MDFRDWAWLPGNLLHIVLGKLASYREYQSFCLVCKPWFSVTREHEEKEVMSLQPLLLMTAPYLDRPIQIWLFNFLTYQSYRLRLTNDVDFKSFCGCSHGWLAFADQDSNLILLNPWSHRTIRLPPLQFEFGSMVFKVVLSNNPDSAPLDCMVAAIYGEHYTLAFTKLGRDSWTYVDRGFKFFNDVIFYADRLLAVDLRACLICLNPCFDFDLPCIDVDIIVPCCMGVMVGTYIVGSRRSGSVLLIRRKYPVDIQIFKLFVVDDCFQWVEIKNLEDETLLVGCNHSVSVSCLGIFSSFPNRVCVMEGRYDMMFKHFVEKGRYDMIFKHFVENPPKPRIDPRFVGDRCPSKLTKLFCLGDDF